MILMPTIRPISLAVLCLCSQQALIAQTRGGEPVLEAVTVEASADASAQGLSKPFAGGQVATGARNGVLGTLDWKNSSFSTTSYTQQLIEDTQSKSVGDVLLNDPGDRKSTRLNSSHLVISY